MQCEEEYKVIDLKNQEMVVQCEDEATHELTNEVELLTTSSGNQDNSRR